MKKETVWGKSLLYFVKGEKQVMKKQKRLLKRMVSSVAAFAMLAGLMPGQMLTAKASSNTVNKYDTAVTTLGVSGIHDPRTEVVNYASSAWEGDYVYYGGHRFRVLDTDTTDFSADEGTLPPKHTMLLDSDSVIGKVTGEHIHFDNDAKPNVGAERASEWEYSDLKAWLNDSNNGFLMQFSKAEIAGIASSTKPDPVANDGKGYPNMRYAPLKDDRVFVLDAVEASRKDYGYRPTSGNVSSVENSLSRVKTTNDDSYVNTVRSNEVGYSGIWWLRSPFYSPRYPQYGGFVNGVSAVDYNSRFYEGGYFSTNIVSYSDPGASPALNVDLDSVLLSTHVNNNNISYYNEYKLTLIYDGLETAITEGQKISILNNFVTVPFTVTDKDLSDNIEADCISVLIVRGDRTTGTIMKYEKLMSDLSFENGTASGVRNITLPDGFDSRTDKIYIFAEDTQDDNESTDYASAPLALLQPGAASNLSYDGTEKSLLNGTSTIPEGYNVQYALSDSAPEDNSYSSVVPKATNAGTYRIWYKATENNASNTIGPNSMTVTIAKKRVEVSGITASDRQYDGTRNVTLSGGTLNASDIVSGDEISIASLEGRFKFADAGENKPVTITKITLDGASKDNYAAYASQSNLTAKVTPKPVIVTGITAVNKEYDGTKTATLNTGSASIEGIVPIDTAVYNHLIVSSKSTAEFEDAAFGINKTVNLGIKLGGYCSLNYTLSEDSQKTATANITKSITIKANDQRVGQGRTIKSGVDNVSVTSGSLEEGHRISNVTLTSGPTDSLTNNGTITLGSVVIQDADEKDVTAMYTITLESGVLTVTEKAPMTVTAPNVTETYDGTAHGIVVNVTDPESGATVKYGETEGTYELEKSPTITNVSESPKTVYYKVTAGGYEDYSGSATITIEPRSVVVSGIKANSRTYNGETGAELDYSDVKFNGETISGLTVTATGEFASASAGQNKTVNISNIVLAGTGTENYVLSTSGQQTTTKADISAAQIPAGSITAPVKIENLTYNGSAQDLVTAGKAEGGTMMYALGTATEATEAYTTSIPAKTDAGTYYIWYKVVGDGNYNDIDAEKVTVNISKKPLTITAGSDSKKFDGTALVKDSYTSTEPAEGESIVSVTITGSQTIDGTSDNVASNAVIKKGDTDVTANYEITYVKGILKVLKSDSLLEKVPVANTGLEENGTEQALVTAGSANNGKLVYSLEENGTYSEDIPTGKDAGNYKVWYKVIGNDGYNDTEAGCIEVVIAKKDESASNTENTENGSGTESGSGEGTLNNQTEDDDNSNVNNGGYDSGNGENGSYNGGAGAANGASSGSGSKTGSDNTSGSGSKTGSDNTSGSGSTTDSDVKVKENADGTKTETVETTNTDGSTTKTQTTKDAEGNVLQTVTQTTNETDNGTVTNTVTKDADGTVLKTVTRSTEKNDDGSTVTTKSTVNSDGTGSSKSTIVDENNNVISTTSTKTTKNKKGTVKVKSETENLEATGSEVKHVDSTVKTYTSEKVKSEITETKADGSSVKTENTIKADKKGNLTVTSKVTEKDADGNTTKSTTTATVKVKKSGALTLSEIDAKGEVAVIPDSVVSNGKTVPVTTIGKGAMQGNETITDVKLGDNITKISKNAFKGDKNLEHIELTDSIKSIAKNAFKGIAKNAVFTIKAASEKEFNRIVDLIKKSGVGKNVTFVFEDTSK